VPEFLQNRAEPKEIAYEVFDILNDKVRYENIKEELAKVKNKLGEPKASTKAAKIIYEFLERDKVEVPLNGK
jgi:lipid A disaccharide synthetase